MEETKCNNKKDLLSRNDIKLLISVVLFTAGVLTPFWMVKTDVATIKSQLISIEDKQNESITRLEKSDETLASADKGLSEKDEKLDATDRDLYDRISNIKK